MVPTVSESSSPENGGSGVDVVGSPVSRNRRRWTFRAAGEGEMLGAERRRQGGRRRAGRGRRRRGRRHGQRARTARRPKVSICASMGPSCVGVPHALSEPLNDDAAFWPHVGSGCTPDLAAFEKHFAKACALLADRVQLLAEAGVRPRRAVGDGLDGSRDHGVDGSLNRVHVRVGGQAVALRLRLGEALVEVVDGLLDAGRIDRQALLEAPWRSRRPRPSPSCRRRPSDPGRTCSLPTRPA